jgi:molecular chaperone DnaK (HSP70)
VEIKVEILQKTSGNKSYQNNCSKRFMGHSLLKSQTKQKEFLTVVKGDNNTPRVDIDGRLYTAQELSAMTLQK